MKLYLIIIGFCIALLLHSCARSEDHSCRNLSVLISSKDSLPIIELDFSKSAKELEILVRNLTRTQPAKNPPHFGLRINKQVYNASIHAAHNVIKPACYGMPTMMHKAPQLEVMMNAKHQIMIDGRDLISIDSIPGYIRWYYPHDYPYGEKIVKLKCTDSHPDSINLVIKNIAKGYSLFYEKEAQLRFSKSVCELDSADLKEVSKKYPFDLRLWIGDGFPPPPKVLRNKSSVSS